MNKRILALLMSLALVVALLPTAAMAVSYSDVNSHWAQSSIERWSDYEVVQGYDGKFAPNGYMTRAQAAAVFTRLLKLNKKADLSVFSDVGQGAWYDEEIAKCVGAGIMNGVSATKMDPNGTITREMFFVMFARAMGIDGESTLNKPMADSAKVSSWAKGTVNALINAGYVSGITEDTIAPALDINRASVMALLDKTISTYAFKDGATVEAKDKGITLIVADNVNVTGSSSNALIVVAKENANVSLKGYKGVPTINVVADKVVIKDAPVSTEINTTANVTAIVNGYQMSKDDQHIVPGAGGGGGGGSSSHTHSYNNVTCTLTKKTIACSACSDEKESFETVSYTKMYDNKSDEDLMAWVAVYEDGSFNIHRPAGELDLTKVTVEAATTGKMGLPAFSREKAVKTGFTELETRGRTWANLVTVPDDFKAKVELNVNAIYEAKNVEETLTYAVESQNGGLDIYGELVGENAAESVKIVKQAVKDNVTCDGTTTHANGMDAETVVLNDINNSYVNQSTDSVKVTRDTSRKAIFEDMMREEDSKGASTYAEVGKSAIYVGGKEYHSFGGKVETEVTTTFFTDFWAFGRSEMNKRTFINKTIKQVEGILKDLNDGNTLTINVTLQNCAAEAD